MDSQGVSFIRHNNRYKAGDRFCEACLLVGRIASLGRMTREEYVMAYHPLDLKRPWLTRHQLLCPVCGESPVVVNDA